jgi:hypothetical protein
MPNNLAGEQDGIDLFNSLSDSTNELDLVYIESISKAATQYGRAWFTDVSVQREKLQNNQAWWNLIWNDNAKNWEVSLFCIPEGAERRSKRFAKPAPVEEFYELSLDDLIT